MLTWDTCFVGKFSPPNIFAVKVYELKIAKMSLFHGLINEKDWKLATQIQKKNGKYFMTAQH